MPEAVASNSIPAPGGQPQATDLTAFHETVCELEALTLMLSAALQGGSFHDDIATGIWCLFRGVADDLRDIYGTVKTDLQSSAARKKLIEEAMVAADLTSVSAREKIERAVDRLTGTGG